MYYKPLHHIFVGVLSLSICIASACKNPIPSIPVNGDGIELPSININNLKLESVYNVTTGSDIFIQGQGFVTDDVISFVPRVKELPVVDLKIQEITSEGIRLPYAANLQNENYLVHLKRGNYTRQIGKTAINQVFNPNIPDVKGKNIKGTVFSNGKGVANVVVSDGVDVTKTDANGIYYLSSTKESGYAFISIPGNYEMVDSRNSSPMFYRYLNAAKDIVEIKDFELKSVNNENHIVLSIADLHLANRTEDLQQFENGFVKDINQQIANYQAQGKKVYGLTLGDLTWDTYWYSNNFKLPEYAKEISKVNAPIFNVIGNHDNDPYKADDWISEDAYRRTFGPTYYSFNIGKIHYVVIDDTEYLNNGGSNGTVGERNYNAKVSDQQMAWLAKDLATVAPNTPIVLATHIQIHNAPDATGILPSFRVSNGQKLIDLLKPFPEVHILTGHTHVNYRVERDNKLMEHNTAAVCATWWWTGRTGYANNQTAPDGSPAGYGIWEMNANQIKWHYKSIGYDNSYQFRAYDLNQVQVTATTHAPNANKDHQALISEYAFGFDQENKNNEVLINVWGYDPKWKIDVTEDGKTLDVKRISARDPLHIISYNMKRLNANAIPSFGSANTSHMFKVKASSPTTTLNIEITDRFGNIYKETMQRPKAFTTSMR